MPGEIKPNSVLLDLRLDAIPTDEVLVKKAKIHEICQIVLFKIIKRRLFRYQVSEVVDTLLGLKLTLLSTSSKATTRTLCLESPNGDVFVLIRVYPRESKKDKVLATVNLELPRPVDIDPEDTLRDAFADFEEGNPDAMGSYPPLRRCKKDVPYLRSSGKMQKKRKCQFCNIWPILFLILLCRRPPAGVRLQGGPVQCSLPLPAGADRGHSRLWKTFVAGTKTAKNPKLPIIRFPFLNRTT